MRSLRRALLMQPTWSLRAPRRRRGGAHVLGTAGRLSGVEGAELDMLYCALFELGILRAENPGLNANGRN